MKSPYFINLENILSELGISRTTMYQRIRAGTFPEIVKLGTRSLGWSSEEFQDVVNAIRAGLTDDEMQELVREIQKGRRKFKNKATEANNPGRPLLLLGAHGCS